MGTAAAGGAVDFSETKFRAARSLVERAGDQRLMVLPYPVNATAPRAPGGADPAAGQPSPATSTTCMRAESALFLLPWPSGLTAGLVVYLGGRSTAIYRLLF